ncbi:unnamed protein product [Diamesa hyperborea]
MKKQERLANKKRKLVALANIVEINETDKAMKNELTRDVDSKTSENMQEEPLQKKQKLKPSSEMTINQSLTDEQYNELKKELALKKNLLKNVPKMRLKFFGEKASLLTPSSKRTPLMLDDLQHLLMSALLGNSSPFKPDRWCVLEKATKITHSVVLVIEGLSGFTFSANESLFLKTKSIFEEQLEVVLPKYECGKIIQELSFVPLTQSYKDNLIRKFGSLEAAVNLTKDHRLISKSVFPIDSCSEDDNEKELPEGEKFPRTRLLLSPLQMMIEGYPLPLQGEFEEKFQGFTLTRKHYKPVTSHSPMFGLDCEMCRTVKGENELARVSIVNEKYESVYESLVRPDNKITDYLTQWSGITKEMMSDVTKTLKEVQNDVFNLLPPDAILVGQSLNCDLNAMKIMHPYVIDTSVIYNITGDRNRKSKLQTLAKTFLGEDIQGDRAGHSSIEDSTTSLKLTKLKLTHDIYYGDVALEVKRNIIDKTEYTGIVEGGAEMKSQDLQEVSTTIFSHAVKRMKKSAIITTEKTDLDLELFYSKNQFELFRNPGAGETADDKSHGIKHHKQTNIKNVINKTREVIIENDFNLSYLNLYEDSIDGSAAPSCSVNEEIASELIPRIDKWIEKIWNSVASNGMFVVIFGGTPQNNNGLSMVQIKK